MMSNISQSPLAWLELETPADAPPPSPLTVRAQTLPARSFFPHHAHAWGQVVYAISGVLTVATDRRSFVISPEQAVWLPPATNHKVGSLHGAEFRSLWVALDAANALSRHPSVFRVSPLLRALIMEAADLPEGSAVGGYRSRVTRLIFDQLERAEPISTALPWPVSEPLSRLCEALYADPSDDRSADRWSRTLGMSPRTLTRRFEAEVGMGLRSWRRRVRLFKAVELLSGGMDVTRTAMELGYGSPSAFTYAFRTVMGQSPQAYMRVTGSAAKVS
ncbi:helix-turn-helix transcriptional regulator [Phenylobacterium sp.]|uniref:AraC family transcriptional regulator n=1 Tax=Phenylobacterium sp. TaxID=1871053 RepID=UPI00301E2123